MEMIDVDLIIKSPPLQFYRIRLLARPVVSVALAVMPFLHSADTHDVETFSLMDEPLLFDNHQVTLDDRVMYFDEFLLQERMNTKLLLADDFTRQYLTDNTVYRTILSAIQNVVPKYFSYLSGISVFVQEDAQVLSVDLLVPLPIEQAVECLDQFDADWWLAYDSAYKDKICVDVVSV